MTKFGFGSVPRVPSGQWVVTLPGPLPTINRLHKLHQDPQNGWSSAWKDMTAARWAAIMMISPFNLPDRLHADIVIALNAEQYNHGDENIQNLIYMTMEGMLLGTGIHQMSLRLCVKKVQTGENAHNEHLTMFVGNPESCQDVRDKGVQPGRKGFRPVKLLHSASAGRRVYNFWEG